MADIPTGMEALRSELAAKGGSNEDWDFLMSEGLKFADVDWVDASRCSDPWKEVNKRLGEGRMVEYRCYDSRKKNQGTAVLEVAGVLDETQHLLKGIHLAASDEYYQWYGEHQLSVDNCAYHICEGGAGSCGFRLPRADKRELIHLDFWRVVNPAILVSQGYGVDAGLARLRSGVAKFVPHPLLPPGGAGGMEDKPGAGPARLGAVGAGLDAMMEEAEAFPPEPLKDRKRKDKEKKEKDSRKSVGSLLNERAESFESGLEEERRRKRRRKKRHERVEKKKQSRGEPGASTSSCEEEDSSSSEQPFQKLSTRGEMDLWRQSQTNPGKLLKGGLQEMGRYLADRVGGDPRMGWEDRKVMSYVNQILMANHSSQTMGIRNVREAQTLGSAIDMLMAGNLGGLGDLLMQRLKALETAVAEQSWSSARHQEMISPQSASLTNQAEREKAAKAELRASKLRAAMGKNKTK